MNTVAHGKDNKQLQDHHIWLSAAEQTWPTLQSLAFLWKILDFLHL